MSDPRDTAMDRFLKKVRAGQIFDVRTRPEEMRERVARLIYQGKDWNKAPMTYKQHNLKIADAIIAEVRQEIKKEEEINGKKG